MTRSRTRLVIPPDGPPLDADQLRALRDQFDLVVGDDARTVLEQGDIAGSDLVLTGGPTANTRPSTLDGELDDAGEALLDLTPDLIESMNSVERLKWLEERLVALLRDQLHFDHFEVRMLNRKTSQLELVIAVGIKPLEVGRSLFARPEGNGISGWVAVSGKPYLCRDVSSDDRYQAGIEDAACALTVPLRLHGRTLGILNIESSQPDAFSEADLRRVQRLAGYIALALHMLNLLVVERFTTRRVTVEAVSEEIRRPLETIAETIEMLRGEGDLSAASREGLDRIGRALEQARAGLRACAQGPRTLLGLDQALVESRAGAVLRGRSVLLVDDDADIRNSVAEVLQRLGCEVAVCENGRQALATLRTLHDRGNGLDVVISDVRLPDLNGYEIFRSARENYPGVPIILMTGFGYDPHHSIVRASQEGLQSILFKPFKAEQLLDEVARAISMSD